MNPFEVRASMLKLAKEYLDLQYKTNVEYATKLIELGTAQSNDVKDFYKLYTSDELIEKANEFYAFVLKKE